MSDSGFTEVPNAAPPHLQAADYPSNSGVANTQPAPVQDLSATDPAYTPVPGIAPEVDLGPEQPGGPTTVFHGGPRYVTEGRGANRVMVDTSTTVTQGVAGPHLQAADYPSESGIYNKEDAARAAGYSWQDIDAHISPAQVAAQDAGYTQDEINQYLGFASPDAMVSRNTQAWAQVQHYDPKTLQPTSDGALDLTANPNWKGDYSAALLRGEVKGPKDFADNYAASAVYANNQQPPDQLLAAGAAGADQLAAQLPGRRDLTDAALSLAPLGGSGSEGSFFTPEQVLAKNQSYARAGDYNTSLSSDQEKSFRAWVASNNVPFDPAQQHPDYDMRGFWQALQNGDERAQGAIDPNDNRMHFPDYWKTPYDLTFSKESQWATEGAPEWNEKDQLVSPDGRVVWDDRYQAPYLGGMGSYLNVKQNLMDHWQETGQPPLDAAIKAQSDPALAAKLTTQPTTLSIFEQSLKNIASEALAGVKDVYGEDLAAGVKDWAGPDPDTFHLLAYIAAKDVDAITRIPPAIVTGLARGGKQYLQEMGMSEAGADDAMRDAIGLAQSIVGGDVRVGTGELAETLKGGRGGFEPFPDRAFGPRPPGPVTDIDETGLLAPPLRQLPAPLRALTQIPIDEIDLAKPTEEAVTQVPLADAVKPAEPAVRQAPEPVATGTEVATVASEEAKPLPFAETATPAEKLQALAQEVIEPNTKANMQGVLNEKADQLETMRLTREGHIPDEFSNPHFFENLAKNEDPETQELAKGYDTATSLRNFFGQVIPDVMKDITGAQPNPLVPGQAPRFRYRQQVAVGEDYVTRLMIGPSNVQAAFVGGVLDKYKLDFAPHMKEWEDSLDALEQGHPGLPPEDTVIGKFIGHMQGVPGFRLSRSDNFYAIAEELSNVNEFTHGWLQWAATNGMIDQPGYINNYFRQNWKNKNEADRIFGGGRQGDTSGTKARKIPNWFEGLRAGLIPAERDPLKIVFRDVTGKLRLANHANMLQTALNDGMIRTQDKSHPCDVKLNWWGKNLYAEPGLAKIYNRWANMRDLPPALENTANYLRQMKNTTVGVHLILPMWHTLLVTKEVVASGYARAWDELTHGEVGQAASTIASSTAVIPRIVDIARKDKARMDRYMQFGGLAPGQKSPDRAVQLIVNAGSQLGPRQTAYRSGNRENLQTSIAAGRTLSQYLADVGQGKQVLGTLVNDLRHTWRPAMEFDKNGVAIVTPKSALAIPGLALGELGNAITSTGGPLFDQLIPMLRRGVIFENADMLLRHNPTASDEYLTKRLNQVVKNTDDRYGEMNQESLFWPRWARMIADATMISTSFFYGTFRWALNSAGVKNISRAGGVHMEWNPIATKSLIALGIVSAIANTTYQKLKTGEWPHSLLDLEFPHPVAHQPGRIMSPGQDKEFVDWAKIGMNTLSAGIDNGWGAALMATTTGLYSYATGKEYNVPDLLRLMETGQDPIGMRPGYMPGVGGGLPGLIVKELAPILLTNPSEVSANLKLSWFEKMILREAPKWTENYPAWRAGQIRLHREWTNQMRSRVNKDTQRTTDNGE